MSPLMISGLLGQWVGAIACMIGIAVCLHGIRIEKKYKAERGFVWITMGALLIGIASFVFAISTKLLGF